MKMQNRKFGEVGKVAGSRAGWLGRMGRGCFFLWQTDCQAAFFPIIMAGMKRLLPTVGAALLAIALVVHADPQDELYATYYGMLQDAESLLAKGEEPAALVRYREVQEGLQKLQSAYPGYNTTVIKFRLEYVTQKIAPLAAKHPNIKPTPKPAVAAPKVMPGKENVPAPVPQPVFTDTEITRLHDQLISLQTEKIMLQKQLKDALAAQPAAVDPKEMAKAQAALLDTQKERDLLKTSLQQEQAKAAKLVDPKEVTAARAQLADTSKELAAQQKAVAKLTEENASLEKKLSKDLPGLKEEVSTLKKQVADANKAAGNALKLEATNKDLASNLAAVKAENESLKSASKKMGDLAKLEAANRTLEAQVGTLKSENSTLKDAAKKAGDVAKLESELKAARAENETLKAASKSMGSVAKLETENRTLAAEAKSLKAQSEALEEQLKAEQKRAANMAKSSNADEALKKELTETQKRLAEQQKAVEQARKGEAQARSAAEEAGRVAMQSKAQAEEAAKLRRENAKLEALLTDPSAFAAAPTASGKAADQLAMLRARIEVLEAKKVPYTKDELALFKAPTSPTALVASIENKPTAGGADELPAAARPLVAEAQRAFNEKRYDVAEDKYEQALKLNENNVFTLSNLAAIQMEQNKLRDAEKNLNKAIGLKKDDAYSLSLLGILKFRQDKYDDALELLSRSAQLDPNSADTQNFLGITLSQKGQRGAAEAALRKAIQIAPGNANAHHNLAVVYATQTPPMTELARWHYQKARGYGHPVNAELEKLMGK